MGKCPKKTPKKLKTRTHTLVSSSNFLSEYFAIKFLKNYFEIHSSWEVMGSQSKKSKVNSLNLPAVWREAWPQRDFRESSDRGGVRPRGRVFASLRLHPEVQRAKKRCSRKWDCSATGEQCRGGHEYTDSLRRART